MTSPEVSIEPVDFVCGQGCGELSADPDLAETSYGKRDGFADSGTELVGESLQLPMRGLVDANTCTLHAYGYTGMHVQLVAAFASPNPARSRSPSLERFGRGDLRITGLYEEDA